MRLDFFGSFLHQSKKDKNKQQEISAKAGMLKKGLIAKKNSNLESLFC